MKKKLTILMVCGIIALSGCGKTQQQTNSGDTIAETDNLTVTALPYPDMKYNDKVIKINDIRLYQSYSEKKYHYNPYLIIRMDKTNLSDEDLHYLCNGDLAQSRYAYMSIVPYYSSESNKLTSERMSLIKKYTDGDELVYAFYDYEQRDAIHPLDDIEINLDIDIIQSNGELVKMTDKSVKNYYRIKINGESEIKIEVKDESEIPKVENDMLEKGFAEIINRGF